MQSIYRYKLILSVIIGLIILEAVLVFWSYRMAKETILEEQKICLMEQANLWRILAQSYNKDILAEEDRVYQLAEKIVSAQSRVAYELIDSAIDDDGGHLLSKSKEDLFSRLSRSKVGRSGYIWILDYEGNYILSKDRLRDGENIWESEDADGNLFIQEMIEKGRRLDEQKTDYYSYWWTNEGEKNPREKIAVILHFPQQEWVVGVSAYYDDLVDMGFRERLVNQLKDLMAKQRVGVSGYVWAIDSAGVYQVSKNNLRNGEDISQIKDEEGKYIIKDLIAKVKQSENGLIYENYSWKNIGEKEIRNKVSGLAYFKGWDWIIGVSVYEEEFEGIIRLESYFKIIIGVIIGICLLVVVSLLALIIRMNCSGTNDSFSSDDK